MHKETVQDLCTEANQRPYVNMTYKTEIIQINFKKVNCILHYTQLAHNTMASISLLTI